MKHHAVINRFCRVDVKINLLPCAALAALNRSEPPDTSELRLDVNLHKGADLLTVKVCT